MTRRRDSSLTTRVRTAPRARWAATCLWLFASWSASSWIAACGDRGGSDDTGTGSRILIDGGGEGGMPTTATRGDAGGGAGRVSDAGRRGVDASLDASQDGTVAADDAGLDGGDTCGSQAADVIWLLDNSCSMAVEAQAVQDNMNAFANSLAAQGVEVNLVLISSAKTSTCACDPGDFTCQLNCLLDGGLLGFGVCIDAPFGSGSCPDDSKPPRFLHLDVPVGSTDALQIALTEYPNYASMMRPGVPKHFAVVSDDDSAMDAATFTAGVAALDGALFDDWTFHGIYSKSTCVDAAAVGTVYEQLVQQTNGASGDLCLQDFPPVFDTFVDAVGGGAGGCP